MSMALKGKRMPLHGRMVAGQHGTHLEWLMEQGLTWRGIKPPEWKPQPKSLKAWLYLMFVMYPRGLVK